MVRRDRMRCAHMAAEISRWCRPPVADSKTASRGKASFFCRGSRAGCFDLDFAATGLPLRSHFAATRPPFGRTRPVASLPLQLCSIDRDNFSVVWPIVRSFDKTNSNGIITNVVPFFCVTFVAAQNVIKESRLPKSRRFYCDRHGAL